MSCLPVVTGDVRQFGVTLSWRTLLESRRTGRLSLPWIVATLVVVSGASLCAEEADRELARKGTELAKQYCYRCHGQTFNGNPQYNVLDRKSLLLTSEGYGAQYVVAGDLNKSLMWQRIEAGEMPPENQPQPMAEEKEVLRRWIEAGAPGVERPERPHKHEQDVLKTILGDLLQTREVNRGFQRYYTLTHLYNNNERVSEFDLRLYRAALSKAINSLSFEPEIVVPQAVDEEQTIFRVDLRDIGWDKRGLWSEILKAYPYGLSFKNVEDEKVSRIAEQVEQLSGTPLAYVRADWLAVTATRPPLYHALLDIPATDAELERFLNVNVLENFQRNRLDRAGFDKSGVSTANNRLVERHASRDGYYWKSYDFRQGNTRARLTQFPLGPKFQQRTEFADLAFVHDGGEQIFSLPNGLQGYMLIDGAGKRIDEGPTDVVRDLTETAGKVAVVNGISCMHCHKHGMIDFRDTIRSGAAVFGPAKQKVLELYPPQEGIAKLVRRDRKRFLEALDQAIGPFLKIGDDADQSIEQFAEPIGAIARFHFRDVELEEAALELGIEDASELKSLIKFNPHLQRLGLKPLVDGNPVDRAVWESREAVTSPFQEAARILERGTPVVHP